MARVSRFTEEFDLTYTSTPTSGYESQTTLADEKTPLLKPAESVAKPKTTTKTLAGAIKGLFTDYKRHMRNLCQNNAHHNSESIEAGSMASISYGAPMDFEAEIKRFKRQSKKSCVDKVFYISPDDEASTFTAYKAKKQQLTTAITKAQATTESRTPDGPTIWAQVYAPTGYQSEIERIENNTKATIEFLGIEIEIEV